MLGPQLRLFADESCTIPATMVVGGIDYEGRSFPTIAEPSAVILSGTRLTRTTGSQTAPSSGTFGWANYTCYIPGDVPYAGTAAVALLETVSANPVYLANMSSAAVRNLVIRAFSPNIATSRFKVDNEEYVNSYSRPVFRPGEKIRIELLETQGPVGMDLGLAISYDSVEGPTIYNPELLATVNFSPSVLRRLFVIGNTCYAFLNDNTLRRFQFGQTSMQTVATQVSAVASAEDRLYFVRSNGEVYSIEKDLVRQIGNLSEQYVQAIAVWKYIMLVVAGNTVSTYTIPGCIRVQGPMPFNWNGECEARIVNPETVLLSNRLGRTITVVTLSSLMPVMSYSTSQDILGIDVVKRWLVISMPTAVEFINLANWSVKRTISRATNNLRVFVNEKQGLAFVENSVVDLNSDIALLFGQLPVFLAWIGNGKAVRNLGDGLVMYKV